MLKKILGRFEQIGITSSVKDNNGNALLMQQSVCSHVAGILNNEYVELTSEGEDFYNQARVIIKNNPDDIFIDKRSDTEDYITLKYNDAIINMTGYNKK